MGQSESLNYLDERKQKPTKSNQLPKSPVPPCRSKPLAASCSSWGLLQRYWRSSSNARILRRGNFAEDWFCYNHLRHVLLVARHYPRRYVRGTTHGVGSTRTTFWNDPFHRFGGNVLLRLLLGILLVVFGTRPRNWVGVATKGDRSI